MHKFLVTVFVINALACGCDVLGIIGSKDVSDRISHAIGLVVGGWLLIWGASLLGWL
ncbi:MAG TPA: hypothetical protein VJ840_18685 [Gemmatimonadaceae bacterium]|nr:hypothetical protein [Gemmatimonadaceae bacterium]